MKQFFVNTWATILRVGTALIAVFCGAGQGMTVLAVMMIADYITGVLRAALGKSDKTSGGRLSASAGFRGLLKKSLMLLAVLGIFLIEVAATRIVSLGSIIIAALYPVGTLINLIAHGASLPTIVFSTVCCVIMAAMVIWLHRSNIERLKNGTEYRFGEKK